MDSQEPRQKKEHHNDREKCLSSDNADVTSAMRDDIDFSNDSIQGTRENAGSKGRRTIAGLEQKQMQSTKFPERKKMIRTIVPLGPSVGNQAANA